MNRTITANTRGANALRGMSLTFALAIAGSAQAGIITSPAIFGSVPHTHISFETRGDSSTITLLQGQSMVMPVGEYAAQGLTFDSPVRWVNDGNALFDAAQLAMGTQHISIPSSHVSTVSFTFTQPVRLFGMFIANNRSADAAGPQITAYDINNAVIDGFNFNTSLSSGTFSGPQGIADYGFVGLSTEVDVHRVVIVKNSAIIDDIRFGGEIPAPGGAALLGLAGLLAGRRRR